MIKTKIKKALNRTFAIIKEMTTTFSGWLSLIITFLIMSGTGAFILGFALGNAWLKGIGGTMMVFYFAPNGIMIFNIVVVAPLWNRYVFRDKGE